MRIRDHESPKTGEETLTFKGIGPRPSSPQFPAKLINAELATKISLNNDTHNNNKNLKKRIIPEN